MKRIALIFASFIVASQAYAGNLFITGNLTKSGTEVHVKAGTTEFVVPEDLKVGVNLSADGNIQATAFFGSGANLTGITEGAWTESGADVYRASGNVGIGTTAPNQKLHVYSPDENVYLKVETNDSTNDKSAYLLLDSQGKDSLIDFQSNGTTKWRIKNDYDGTGDHQFKIEDDGDVRLSITQTGNVGIGETAPNTALEVTGAISMDTLDGNTLIVSPNSAYTTITLAMAAAAANDTILVAEGTYAEKVTFTQDNLTLRALGSAENTIISGASNDHSVDMNPMSGCTLDGFTVNQTSINATADYCIDMTNDSASDYNTVENCIVNVTLDGTVISNGIHSENGNCIVRNNRVTVINTNTGAPTLHAIHFATGGGHEWYIENNVLICTSSSTATSGGLIYGVLMNGASTTYFRNNFLEITSDHQTNGNIYAFHKAYPTNAYVSGNTIRAICTSTGMAKTVSVGGGSCPIELSNNSLFSSTADGDGYSISSAGDLTSSGNIITGDGAISITGEAVGSYISKTGGTVFLGLAEGTSEPAGVVAGEFWIDTDDGRTVKSGT